MSRFLFIKSGRYGYVDGAGAVAIPPTFKLAREFSGNRAQVIEKGKVRFIGPEGAAIPGTFDAAEDFRDGLARVRIDGNPALIDSEGRYVIRPEFQEIQAPAEGFIGASRDSQWTYFDVKGRTAFGPLPYPICGEFREGLAAVSGIEVVDGGARYQTGFIDRRGELVIPLRFDSAASFHDGHAFACSKDGRWGVIDKAGAWKIHPRYNEIRRTTGDMAIVWRDQVRGYVDLRAMREIALKYAEARPFSEGLGGVATQRGEDGVVRYGFIDRSGAEVIPPEFGHIGTGFSDGLAGVVVDGEWGFINTRGKFAVQPQFEWDTEWATGDGNAGAYHFHEGFAAVRKDGRWGYLSREGRVEITPRFQRATPFKNGVAAVRQEGRWGLINRSGAWLVEPALDWVGPFQDEVAQVLVGGRIGYIRQSGGMLWTPPGKADPIDRPRIEKDLVIELTRSKAGKGAPPRYDAVLVNRSKEIVHRIVRPGDGSDAGWREPQVWTTTEVARGKGRWTKLPPPQIQRCGMYDHHWQPSVQFLRPNEEFVLWRGAGIDQRQKGRTRVRVHYAYRGGAAGKGGGGTPGGPTGLMEDTPPFELVSAPIEFTVT